MPQLNLHIEARRFYVAAVLLALAVWPIGFHLGAYGTIFYDRIFQIWVASLAALLAGIVLDVRYETRFTTPLRAIILLMPTIWVIGHAFFLQGEGLATRIAYWGFTLFIVLVSLPYIVKSLLTITMPEVTEIHDRRLTHFLAAITLFTAFLAYLSGHYNNLLLTCDDFEIAGDFQPGNCAQAEDFEAQK
ncbi:hypothetical protein ACMA5I_14490 [Paracoccaceae bacterium GXU_MW_L88]